MKLYGLLESLFEGAYVVDKDRKILYWNKRAEAITGYSKEQVIGKHCYDNLLRHVNDEGCQLCHSGCPLLDTIETKKTNFNKVYLHHAQGHRIPIFVRTFIYEENESNPYAIEFFTDTPDEKSMQEEYHQLKKDIIRDPLTQVYNRAFLDYQLDLCINEYMTFKTEFGILFVDIDYFKKVNDTYGHTAGDNVLKTVSKTLTANFRRTDYIGRYGGEEFLIILRDINKKDLVEIAEKIRTLVENTTVVYENQKISVTISIGGLMYNPSLSKDELIENADQNMYKAKENGRNQTIIR